MAAPAFGAGRTTLPGQAWNGLQVHPPLDDGGQPKLAVLPPLLPLAHLFEPVSVASFGALASAACAQLEQALQAADESLGPLLGQVDADAAALRACTPSLGGAAAEGAAAAPAGHQHGRGGAARGGDGSAAVAASGEQEGGAAGDEGDAVTRAQRPAKRARRAPAGAARRSGAAGVPANGSWWQEVIAAGQKLRSVQEQLVEGDGVPAAATKAAKQRRQQQPQPPRGRDAARPKGTADGKDGAPDGPEAERAESPAAAPDACAGQQAAGLGDTDVSEAAAAAAERVVAALRQHPPRPDPAALPGTGHAAAAVPELVGEVVIWISICSPGQPDEVDQEYLVLGSQRLCELRDVIRCGLEALLDKELPPVAVTAAAAGGAGAGAGAGAVHVPPAEHPAAEQPAAVGAAVSQAVAQAQPAAAPPARQRGGRGGRGAAARVRQPAGTGGGGQAGAAAGVRGGPAAAAPGAPVAVTANAPGAAADGGARRRGGSYLFFEGCFYNDMREPGAEDYSAPILELCRAQGLRPTHLLAGGGNFRPAVSAAQGPSSASGAAGGGAGAGAAGGGLQWRHRGGQPPHAAAAAAATAAGAAAPAGDAESAAGAVSAACMDATTFGELSLRPGSCPAYLFCHRACCEHLVMVRDVRRWHPGDPPERSAFPHQLRAPSQANAAAAAQASAARRRCAVCERAPAEVATRDDSLAPCNPCRMCRGCFEMLHTSADGTLQRPGLVVQPYRYNPLLDAGGAWPVTVLLPQRS